MKIFSSQKLFILLAFVQLPLFSWKVPAHEETLQQNSVLSEREQHIFIEEIYKKTLAFTPEIFEGSQKSLAHPYMKVGKQIIPMNPAFWDLVRSWIRLYRSEIQKHCPCDIDEYELVQKAQDQVAKGFFHSKIKQPVSHKTEHFILEGYKISSQYGKTYGKIAISLIIAAETAETVIFNLHSICTPIYIAVLAFLREAQSYGRVFSNSKTLNQNRFLMSLRFTWLNHVMRKAQKNVFHHLESTSIDEEGLSLSNAEGPKNKREKWVRSLIAKTKPLLDKIRDLDKKLEDENLSNLEKKQTSGQKTKASSKSKSL